MFEIAPTSIFSSYWHTRTPAQELVEFAAAWWRERAELELQGSHYQLYREGMMSGDFVLDRRGTIVARASKPSAFRDRFEFEIDGRTFSLRKPNIFSLSFVVYEDVREVGWIRPVHWWGRRTRVDLPAAWPLEIQLFVFWLALVLWRRQRRRT